MTDPIKIALIMSIPGYFAGVVGILNHFGIRETVKNTDGINSRLERQIETKDSEAKHVAELTDKDKTIAALTKKVNGEGKGNPS